MPFRSDNWIGGEGKSRDCPNCHSSRIYQNGKRKSGKGTIQRYLCRDCRYRFSESSILSIRPNNIGGCQVCAVLTEEAKNLASVEPSNGGLAGATGLTKDTENILFGYAWWLKKQGRRDQTIQSHLKLLKRARCDVSAIVERDRYATWRGLRSNGWISISKMQGRKCV